MEAAQKIAQEFLREVRALNTAWAAGKGLGEILRLPQLANGEAVPHEVSAQVDILIIQFSRLANEGVAPNEKSWPKHVEVFKQQTVEHKGAAIDLRGQVVNDTEARAEQVRVERLVGVLKTMQQKKGDTAVGRYLAQNYDGIQTDLRHTIICMAKDGYDEHKEEFNDIFLPLIRAGGKDYRLAAEEVRSRARIDEVGPKLDLRVQFISACNAITKVLGYEKPGREGPFR